MLFQIIFPSILYLILVYNNHINYFIFSFFFFFVVYLSLFQFLIVIKKIPLILFFLVRQNYFNNFLVLFLVSKGLIKKR